MSDFTPGPWRIGAIESGMVAIDGANGEEVTGFVSPEDGHLIAAAPDLLDALKRCKFDSLNMTLEDREFCRAAIAKATGEQP